MDSPLCKPIDAIGTAEPAGKPKASPLNHWQFSLRFLFGAVTAVAIFLGPGSQWYWIDSILAQLILGPLMIAAVILGCAMLIQLPIFLLLWAKGALPPTTLKLPDQEPTEMDQPVAVSLPKRFEPFNHTDL
ncbi:MAG: hypothetical protein IT427_03890 [Pirellulales bacterium]|nr:hypothetical protein [Pirellulales bacterium]